MRADPRPALGYKRVSSEKQAGETVTSLGDQEAAISALAQRLGAHVVEWFADEGISGATVEKRPGLRALFAYCEAHPRTASAPGFVLVLNHSRLGRFADHEEATYWRVMLRKRGWVMRFAEGGVDDDGIGGSVVNLVNDAQASEYRKAIIRNAQRGRRGTAELGYWGSREPFGFRRAVVYPPDRARTLGSGVRKADDEKVKLVVHDDEATLVRWAFTSYARGVSMGAISAEFARQYPARKWSRPVLRALLINPAYVGDTVIGRRSGELVRNKVWAIDASQWRTIPDTHPAIVSRALFEQVRRRLAANHRPPPQAGYDYKLTGLVTCAHCGGAFTGGGFGGTLADGTRVHVYRDSGHVAGKCEGALTTIGAHILERAVLTNMTRELARPAVSAAIRRAVDQVLAPEPSHDPRPAIRQELARAEARRDRLVAAFAEGVLSDEEARTALQSTREAIARLRGDLEAAAPRPVDIANLTRERERLLRFALDFGRVANAANGRQLRDLLAPWLAGATFERSSRVLTLRVRQVPLSLVRSDVLVTHQPGPG